MLILQQVVYGDTDSVFVYDEKSIENVRAFSLTTPSGTYAVKRRNKRFG